MTIPDIFTPTSNQDIYPTPVSMFFGNEATSEFHKRLSLMETLKEQKESITEDKFNVRMKKYYKTGVLTTTKTNQAMGMTNTVLSSLIDAKQQDINMSNQDILPNVKDVMNNSNWRDKPQRTESIKHQITVSSWDVDSSGTLQLPRTIDYRYVQCREIAIRSDIYNIRGVLGQFTINGTQYNIEDGSYTPESLKIALKDKLESIYTGRRFTVLTSPISYKTVITLTAGADIPNFNFSGAESPLLKTLGFHIAYNVAVLNTTTSSSVTSDKPIDVSTLNLYGFSFRGMEPQNTNYMNNMPVYHGIAVSSSASGSICRAHAGNICDLGSYRTTQSITIDVRDISAKTSILPQDTLWSIIIDLW